MDACAHVVIGSLILYLALQEAHVLSQAPTSTKTFIAALPLLFFAAIPPLLSTEAERIARVTVVALAVLESLVAYPVAASQVRWSSLLIVAVGMLCLHDGLRQLPPLLAVVRRRGRRVAAGMFTSAVVLASLVWSAGVLVGDVSAEASSYHANTQITLPGSGMIRLPASQAEPLELISRAIRAQCSTFVTLPGMNSFYFWSEEAPPTDWFNVWYYTGDRPLQKQIVDAIDGQDGSRFCIVDNAYALLSWKGSLVVPQLPLVRLVESLRREVSPPQRFGSVQSLFGYQLFVSHAPNEPSGVVSVATKAHSYSIQRVRSYSYSIQGARS